MKANKWLFGLVLALVLCMCASVAMAVSTADELKDAIQKDTDSVITLATDITFTARDLCDNIGINKGGQQPETHQVSILVGRDITIDLNGRKLETTVNDDDVANWYFGLFGVKDGYTLTIKDSKGTGVLKASRSPSLVISAVDGGSVIIDSSATVQGADAGIYVINGGVANIYGEVHAVGHSIMGNGSDPSAATTINVYAGATITSDDVGIYHPQQGTLNVYGGKISSKNVGIEMRNGNLNISGAAVVETTASDAFRDQMNNSGSAGSNAAISIIPHNVSNIKPISVTISDSATIKAAGSSAAIGVADPHNKNTTQSVTINSGNVAGNIVVKDYGNAIINSAVDVTVKSEQDAETVILNNAAVAAGTSATYTAPRTSHSTPRTGDETNIALLVCLMALSAVAFVALGKKTRFN